MQEDVSNVFFTRPGEECEEWGEHHSPVHRFTKQSVLLRAAGIMSWSFLSIILSIDLRRVLGGATCPNCGANVSAFTEAKIASTRCN